MYNMIDKSHNLKLYHKPTLIIKSMCNLLHSNINFIAPLSVYCQW